MIEIEISAVSPERLGGLLSPPRRAEFERAADEARQLLAGRVVWNVNSTARGGGVVELLRPMVAYARGVGVDARWVVVHGNPAFFAVTKRLHNWLHGDQGDGGALDADARRIYEETLLDSLGALGPRLRARDVVIVHDPQPAGLIPSLVESGATVIWRCHVGMDTPNSVAREAWAFLLPYVTAAQVCVFSRAAFAWDGLERDRIAVIAPSIDPMAPKNVELAPEVTRAALLRAGLLSGESSVAPVFVRQDGSPGRVERRAQVVEDQTLRDGDPVVLQVSRWDALKDPKGVIQGFAEHVPADTGAHLVYAGPDVESVADDPEGRHVLEQAIGLRAQLPREQRGRIHLASLPTRDSDENAIIVNALQRHATVVVQKSLAEGFGLTVAEAMWKGRPVVASRIGGIQDQIVHGESGLLLDARDLAGFGGAVTQLLANPADAARMGARAREQVRDRFLNTRNLIDYLRLIESLDA
ncbi:MAG TPA: glycosyltransferase [Gaiellales bacterium]|nr:glycosyltransferase [Gaiellales bacterium]